LVTTSWQEERRRRRGSKKEEELHLKSTLTWQGKKWIVQDLKTGVDQNHGVYPLAN
jgi:hypothetical protein